MYRCNEIAAKIDKKLEVEVQYPPKKLRRAEKNADIKIIEQSYLS
jgi:hypothetical protein